MNLYGGFLEEPKLRFDYSSTHAEDTYSKRGLSRHGPYDSNLFGKDKIKCIVLFPNNSHREKQILIDGLTKGEGTFNGFKSFFKIPLEFISEISFSSVNNINLLLEKIPSKDPDIVYVILPSACSDLYKQIKTKMLANGISSQMVKIEKLNNSQGRQYTIENIALASYAKVGGTPWTVSTPYDENNLILGVSRAQDYSRKYLVGFVTLFTNDGDFLFMNSKAPVVEWKKYVQGLSELIESAVSEYEDIRGAPNSIIVHFHKRPGEKEIESIETALRNITKDIPYAIVHLNEYSNFRLFDSSHNTYTPPKGFKVSLSSHEALILLDGRIGDRRFKVGVPRVLDVRMDKRSTLDLNKFQDIVKQVYDFSHINWRGFNAAAIPVTLNYSKLIARIVIEIGIENWNPDIARGKLRDKAWFL